MKNRLSSFEKKICYTFKDKELLAQALTHSSYSKEMKDGSYNSNERLEFLGDAFLDAIAGEELYKRLPQAKEGKLTKLRAAVVCEKSLAEQGKELEIGEYLLMGKGEEKTGGRYRTSITADALEAVIGAIYLDGGYEKSKEIVLKIFEKTIEDAINGKLIKDYKSALQEKAQSKSNVKLVYTVTKEEGPEHDKKFHVSLLLNDNEVGTGVGSTKKEAEQSAAKEAMERGIIDVL